MTKEQFYKELDNDSWKPDGEYEGVYKLKGTSIYVWWRSEAEMRISWGLEYTISRTPTSDRILALVNAFQP